MKNYLIILFVLFSYSLYSQPTNVVFTDNIDGYNDWGDYNNDGYLDFVITGRAGQYPNIYLKTALYLNYDGYFYEVANLPFIAIENISIEQGNIKWIDYNNDNNLDLFISGDTDITYNTTHVSKIYKNNGNATFSEVDNLSFANNGGFADWADFDNDGDFDLLLFSDTTTIYFNEGNGSFIEYTDTVINKIYKSLFAIGDFNNDSFIDIIGSSTVSNKKCIFKNNGNGSFIEISSNNFPQTNVTLTIGDSDNDGDLDILFCGFETPSNLQIYKNNGNNTFTQVLATGGNGYTTWGDYNNDGRLDFITTGTTDDGDGGISSSTDFFQNIGNNNFIPDYQLLPSHDGDAHWADYDNDGDLDISISGNNYTIDIIENISNTTNQPPNAPINLTTTTNGNDLILQWDKSTDDHNPSSSLSYNVYFGTTDSLTKIISPMSDISTGIRKVSGLGNAGMNNFYILKNLPDGQYAWGVQAIDHSFKGSAFSVCDTIDFITSNLKLQTSTLKLKIFPNPVTLGNDFTIYSSENNKNSVIEIYNVTGELIYSQPTQTNRTKINKEKLGKGVFWVKVKNSEGLINVEKLIIL